MTADRGRDPGESPEPAPAGASRRDGESVLDRLLDEASRAERDLPAADADRFLARLSPRLESAPRARIRLAPALSLAAMVPIALAVWWFIAGSDPAADPGTFGGDPAPAAETALLEELELLELLAELAPASGESLDPDLIDLYFDFEIIDELPVETLGSSG